jgi:hypothetical protein
LPQDAPEAQEREEPMMSKATAYSGAALILTTAAATATATTVSMGTPTPATLIDHLVGIAAVVLSIAAVASMTLLAYEVRRVLAAVNRINRLPSAEWFEERTREAIVFNALLAEHNLLHKRCLAVVRAPENDCEGSI